MHSLPQVICVAGTKAEIPKRQVTEKEGREWASSKGFPFFEVRTASMQHSQCSKHNVQSMCES